MNVRDLNQKVLRWMSAAGLLAGLAVIPLWAEEGRRSPPDQDSGPKVRVESSGRGASASDTRPGSSSSSSGSGRSAVSSRDSRPSSPSGVGNRTRVERRHDGGSWHGDRYGRHDGNRYHNRYGNHHHRGRTYIWYHDPFYYWPWWWGGGPYGYYPRYGYGAYGYERPGYYGYEQDSGALDFDVSPENAEIYVDGQYVGVADDFDGFPAYLWLPKGTYDVVVYMPGFTTIARQYSVYPGLVIDVEDAMQHGDAVRPEDLPSKSTVNRDERLRRDRERTEEVERWERQAPPRNDGRSPGRSVEREAGRLILDLEPSDASVYLDGRFLGTAADLERLHSGLIVDPGKHKLEVVRPGYESETVEFEVEPGEEAQVSLELEAGEDT